MALVRADSPPGPARRRSSASPRWARNSAGVRYLMAGLPPGPSPPGPLSHPLPSTGRGGNLRRGGTDARPLGSLRALPVVGMLDALGLELGGVIRATRDRDGLLLDSFGFEVGVFAGIGDGLFLDALGLQLDHGDSGMEALGGDGLGDQVLVAGDLRGEDVGVEVDGEGSEGERDLSLGELDGAAAGAGALGSLGGDVAVGTDFVKHGGVPFSVCLLRCCYQSGLTRTAHWGKPGSTPYSPSIPKLISACENDCVVSNSMPRGSRVGIQRTGRGPVGRAMIMSTLFSVPGAGL